MKQKKVLHFVGIGGMGMSAIANAFLEQGYKVQGSDVLDNDYTASLKEKGVRIFQEHSKGNIKGADLLIVSTAIPDDSLEVLAAKELGIRVIHRSVALQMLAKNKRMIAVSGTHGKSSISAMLVSIFGADNASFVIGAPIKTKNGVIMGGHAANAPIFIAEADESDRSFLHYKPETAIINNIDADHMDNYNSLDDIENAFLAFARNVSKNIVISADDYGAKRLTKHIVDGRVDGERVLANLITVGEDLGADVRISDVTVSENGLQIMWNLKSDLLQIDTHLRINSPALYHVPNSSMAFVAALLNEATPEQAKQGIEDFCGAEHRFEIRGEINDILIIDDYAHHPTAITALLKSARQLWKRRGSKGKIRILYQPLVFSRTRIFQREIAEALQAADEIIVTQIFDSREPFDPNTTPETVTQHIDATTREVYAIADLETALKKLTFDAVPGDIIITAGGGDIGIRTRHIVDLV
ncbi:MAG: UDP-N-acetylmuramate--L-alanine ligase [Bifidobacteriaceae bacterium]|jgi:UDP-N-acetylmuramate--alanine ligase|nr:UDP-N-acetylmuramate--L-alanine ligase [Bifidobacteriaceae bacterium]